MVITAIVIAAIYIAGAIIIQMRNILIIVIVVGLSTNKWDTNDYYVKKENVCCSTSHSLHTVWLTFHFLIMNITITAAI